MAVNTVVHVGEVWTEVYARIAPTPSPFRVVMMPGNPGNVVVYESFIEEVYRLLGERCSVYGSHGAPGRNSGRIYTVEDQVNHKVAFLKGLVAGTWQELNETDSAEQSNSFVLMGHSIGAFFALKTWNRVSGTNVNVLDACLIMPTICELYKGYSRFNKIVTLPYVRNAFATLAHYLPSSFLRSAASRIGNQGDKLGEMVATKIDYHIVMNITSMGYEEGATIFGVDEEITAALGIAQKRAYFFYSPSDPYTSQEIINDTVSKFPTATVTMTDASIPHAFVISHTEVVAPIVISKLLEDSFPEFAAELAAKVSK